MDLAEFIRRHCDLEDPETHGALDRVAELEHFRERVANFLGIPPEVSDDQLIHAINDL